MEFLMRALIKALDEAAPDPEMMARWKASMPESFMFSGRRFARKYVTGYAAGAGAIRRSPAGIRVRYVGQNEEFVFYAYIEPSNDIEARHFAAKKAKHPDYKTDGLDRALMSIDFTWSRGGGVMHLATVRPGSKMSAATMTDYIESYLSGDDNEGEAGAS